MRKVIDTIKRAGFSHIKVEMEAQFNRRSYSDDPCPGCSGNLCEDCDWEGRETLSLDMVKKIVLKSVSPRTRRLINYIDTYYDGGDTECTFTMPIEAVRRLPEVIQAFADIKKITGTLTVDYSGMHVAILPEGCDGKYPTRIEVNKRRHDNFVAQVSKLMPALFFLAAYNGRCRTLNPRSPRVSADNKYSAIYTHKRTCFEYRVFETCYDNPKAVLDYVAVIAKTLEYFIHPRKRVDDSTFSELPQDIFGNTHTSNALKGQLEYMKALERQLKVLAPQRKSIKQYKRERGVDWTRKRIKSHQKALEPIETLYTLDVSQLPV